MHTVRSHFWFLLLLRQVDFTHIFTDVKSPKASIVTLTDMGNYINRINYELISKPQENMSQQNRFQPYWLITLISLYWYCINWHLSGFLVFIGVYFLKVLACKIPINWFISCCRVCFIKCWLITLRTSWKHVHTTIYGCWTGDHKL